LFNALCPPFVCFLERSRMSAQAVLSQAFTLPNGTVIKNRLFKSAMSEALGQRDGSATPELVKLYGAWADGGVGLCVTGNVMIDKRAVRSRLGPTQPRATARSAGCSSTTRASKRPRA
jgi:2,4-dienoyl-CoA reductase-like NADH-dependent reductase (Old Yellow Enzyme family)